MILAEVPVSLKTKPSKGGSYKGAMMAVYILSMPYLRNTRQRKCSGFIARAMI